MHLAAVGRPLTAIIDAGRVDVALDASHVAWRAGDDTFTPFGPHLVPHEVALLLRKRRPHVNASRDLLWRELGRRLHQSFVERDMAEWCLWHDARCAMERVAEQHLDTPLTDIRLPMRHQGTDVLGACGVERREEHMCSIRDTSRSSTVDEHLITRWNCDALLGVQNGRHNACNHGGEVLGLGGEGTGDGLSRARGTRHLECHRVCGIVDVRLALLMHDVRKQQPSKAGDNRYATERREHDALQAEALNVDHLGGHGSSSDAGDGSCDGTLASSDESRVNATEPGDHRGSNETSASTRVREDAVWRLVEHAAACCEARVGQAGWRPAD